MSLVSVIFDGAGREKTMVSPLVATPTAARSVPGPLSAVLVTVIVAARNSAGAIASASVRQRTNGIWPMVLRAFVFTPDSAKSAGETYQAGDLFKSCVCGLRALHWCVPATTGCHEDRR